MVWHMYFLTCLRHCLSMCCQKLCAQLLLPHVLKPFPTSLTTWTQVSPSIGPKAVESQGHFTKKMQSRWIWIKVSRESGPFTRCLDSVFPPRPHATAGGSSVPFLPRVLELCGHPGVPDLPGRGRTHMFFAMQPDDLDEYRGG